MYVYSNYEVRADYCILDYLEELVIHFNPSGLQFLLFFTILHMLWEWIVITFIVITIMVCCYIRLNNLLLICVLF
jgi:hypothetical protein